MMCITKLYHKSRMSLINLSQKKNNLELIRFLIKKLFLISIKVNFTLKLRVNQTKRKWLIIIR